MVFEIPSQGADRALVEFARQAQVSVLFPAGQFSQVTTRALQGEYLVDQALGILLRDTGLVAELLANGSVSVKWAQPRGEGSMEMAAKKNWLTTLFAALGAALSTHGAQAQSADGTATLEEVVITAQKRTERLADVPVSAQVLSSDTVSKLNAGDVSDLNRLVPSVNLNGTINGRVPLGVRGVSSVSNEGTVGLSSGVAIMIDGVPVPSDSRAGNSLEDVQSIEVLKGPQATLGGRTAAAGVINIVTRQPTDQLAAGATALATNDNEYRVNGFVSGPIGDTAKFSLAGYYTDRQYPIKNVKLNKFTSQTVYGMRAKLLLQPTDKLDITLATRLGQDNSDGFNFVYTHLSPGIYLLTGAGGPPFMSQASLLPGITPGWDNQRYSSPVNAYAKVKDTDASVDVQYHFDKVTLASTTAFQQENQYNVQDLFAVNDYFWNLLTGAGSGAAGTPPPFYNFQFQDIRVKQVSEELKLVSAVDQPFSYVVGLFYSDTKITQRYSRDLLPALQDVYVSPDTKTTDLYARGTFKLGGNNSLIVGGRLNEDKLSYNFIQYAYAASFPPPVLYNGLSAKDSSSETSFVGDLSFQHKYNDNVMTYATYARGYSPAAYNTAQSLTPTATKLGLVKKENIDHIEIGTKGSYLDNRVTLNAALFDTKYKDFQVQIFDQSNTSINPPLILANAGAAETRGLEADIAFAATDTLRIDLNAAYIDAKFNDYKGAPCYYPDSPGVVPAGCFQKNAAGTIVTRAGQAQNPAFPVVQDLDGKVMPNSPKVKFSLSAEQRIPLASGNEVVLGGNYAYRSSAQMLVDQNPYAVQKAFGILNLSFGVRSKSGKSSATLFVNNVTDQHYFTDVEDFWSGPWGGTNAIVGQPARDTNRYVGIRLSTGL